MALTERARNDDGPRWFTGREAPPRRRRTVIPLNSEDSFVEFKRDRSNVRPYVRSSTNKLKWTVELHQSFMRAVIKLGGKDKATPKKILQHMNTNGITIAHIKSHLQMYRTGKIDLKSLPHSTEYDRSMEEAREVHMALELLKKGRISGASGTETVQMKSIAAMIEAFKQPKKVQTREFVPVMEEPHERYRETPRLESFLDETMTDSSSNVPEEPIELDLTMATRMSSPNKLQFPCPSSPEEASLSLGLS